LKNLNSMKLNLKAKILILILTTTMLIFITTIGYVSITFKNKAIKDAMKLADSYAAENANLVASYFNTDIGLSRALSGAYTDQAKIQQAQRLAIYDDILKNIFASTDYLAVWTSIELSAWDTAYTKNYGRIASEAYNNFGKVDISHRYRNMEGDDTHSSYYAVKMKPLEHIIEPYFYSYSGSSSDEILVASVSAPVVKNGKFIGLSGVDISMETFQRITDNIKPFEESYAVFVTYTGKFVAHPNKKYINESIKDVDFQTTLDNNVLERIQKGKPFSFIKTEENGEKNYISYAPVNVGKSDQPWAIGIIVPLKVISAEANQNLYNSMVFIVLGLIVLSIVTFFIARYISKPLIRITEILRSLAKGEIDETQKMRVKSDDEIGDIRKSVNTFIDGLLSTAEFANNIGKGNLDAEFTLLSKNDVLGKSLLEMRKSLRQARDEEAERKKLDEQVSWATIGTAKFGAILRSENENIEDLSFNIISNLVNYLGAIQGGIFILSSEDSNNMHYKMTASYAYNRKRFADKVIGERDGLVGRCGFEKQSIYLEDIPNDHVKITSGLGDSNPRSLLLVPLLLNDEIFGVIEVASFNKFEKYQIEFTEKIGEIIASTISNVRTAIKTANLLKQSQEQAEEMTSQEEELRQNMEELQATQEEMERKSREQEMRLSRLNIEFEAKIKELNEASLNSKVILEALEKTTYLVEYDFKGNIIYANEYVASLFNTKVDLIVGTKHSDNMGSETLKSPAEYAQFWYDLKSGETITEENLYYIDNKKIWLSETYVPFFTDDGKPFKVLKIAHNITKDKETGQELILEKDLQARKIREITALHEERELELKNKLNETQEKLKKHEE